MLATKEAEVSNVEQNRNMSHEEGREVMEIAIENVEQLRELTVSNVLIRRKLRARK